MRTAWILLLLSLSLSSYAVDPLCRQMMDAAGDDWEVTRTGNITNVVSRHQDGDDKLIITVSYIPILNKDGKAEQFTVTRQIERETPDGKISRGPIEQMGTASHLGIPARGRKLASTLKAEEEAAKLEEAKTRVFLDNLERKALKEYEEVHGVDAAAIATSRALVELAIAEKLDEARLRQLAINHAIAMSPLRLDNLRKGMASYRSTRNNPALVKKHLRGEATVDDTPSENSRAQKAYFDFIGSLQALRAAGMKAEADAVVESAVRELFP